MVNGQDVSKGIVQKYKGLFGKKDANIRMGTHGTCVKGIWIYRSE